MGWLDYAWATFFEKDYLKARLLVSPRFRFPQLFRDDRCFVCVVPEPVTKKIDGKDMVLLMGYSFPVGALGKLQLASLFRASVTHLGAHAVCSNPDDYAEWSARKDVRLAKFTMTLLEDVMVYTYIQNKHTDKLVDLAFANALALKRMRKVDRFINPATRMMANLLVWLNAGFVAGEKKKDDASLVYLYDLIDQFRKKSILSLTDKNIELNELKLEVADAIYNAVQDAGTITECPFLPHTEELGSCSIFLPLYNVETEITAEEEFKRCITHLGGTSYYSEDDRKIYLKVAEAEAEQIFESWKRQQEKEQNIIAKYSELLSLTQFKSVEIPEQDYAKFLRAKAACKSEAHRLLESLLVARDALDEDPRKDFGVLDLQEVIQVIASKSPRMDVFMLDENLSKSYSWAILLDASKSIRYTKDFAMEIFILLADVASSLLLDPASWGAYAFNDRFLIIKDFNERYNARVKARIGGIEFDGFTYMPDALKMAANLLKSRAENLRLITIISDGWPYGYQDMRAALAETVEFLAGKNIAVLAIGVKSRQMELVFKSCSTVYSLRELTKFSNLYLSASRTAAET
ncbi:VWA domain-containing protein [Candidatus Bathyarchaeota archaeon]|nr:VWA domain-containing protein [Candidatus Bathyarchaeota archaeon]